MKQGINWFRNILVLYNQNRDSEVVKKKFTRDPLVDTKQRRLGDPIETSEWTPMSEKWELYSHKKNNRHKIGKLTFVSIFVVDTGECRLEILPTHKTRKKKRRL